MPRRERIVERVADDDLHVTQHLEESGRDRAVPLVQRDRRVEVAGGRLEVATETLDAQPSPEDLSRDS